MKVAVDTGPTMSGHSIRGIGVATRQLLEAFKEHPPKDIQIFGVDFSKEDLSKYDVVHYQAFRPFFRDLPIKKPAKKVVLTIHDLIPLIYPKHYPYGVKGWLNWQINKWLIGSYVDAIITISETSKKDICRFLGVSPDKVYVIYLAALPAYKKIYDIPSQEFPEKFVFNLGDINYNKNIPNLVKACETLNIPLVIAGKQAAELERMNLDHAEHKHLRPVYKALTDGKRVIRPGYITDEEANITYNLASVYVQPSFYEGFGLSVIHAFAAGCPVVAAKTPALVEIGDDACLFADPDNPDDIAIKIKSVLVNNKLRGELVKNGYSVVKKFSWEKTSTETLKVYGAI